MASGDYVGYTGGPQFQLPEKQLYEEIEKLLDPPTTMGAKPSDFPHPVAGSLTIPPPPPPVTPADGIYFPQKAPPYQALGTPAPSGYSSDLKQSYFPETSQPPTWNQTTAEQMPLTPDTPATLPAHMAELALTTSAPTAAQPHVPEIIDQPQAVVLNHRLSIPSAEAPEPSTTAQVLQPPLSEQPQRPDIGVHHYTEPYVASGRLLSEHTAGMHVPQYEEPYIPVQAQSSEHPTSIIAPVQPLSAPPTMYNPPQAQLQQVEPICNSVHMQPTDETKNHGVKRFIGNMVYVRAARSTVQTVVSSAKLPFYLSPWGDNNPVTLPNIRKRDVAFFGLAFIGLEALAPGMVELVGPLVHNGIHATTEAVADETVSKMTKGKAPVINSNAGTISMQLRITHKLIGQEASITFMEERENIENRMDCHKGWFCPYLYASCRLPQIPRNKDFAVAQFYSPGLAADAAIAPTFLNALQNSYPVANICPYTSPSLTHAPFRRMAILFVGLAPFRTASAWSQSRIPNEARLTFHLLTHVPAVVIPVKASAPVCAWSPWTMAQIMASGGIGGGALAGSGGATYDADRHYYELLAFVESVVDEPAIDADKAAEWRGIVAQGFLAIIRGVQQLESTLPGAKALVNPERAGIAMFRF